jgi:short-subunit dehydrogenase
MNLQLKGKRAIVSGSTAGIGYAIASALAREGAAVVVNGRTPARVDEAVGRIRAEHAGATVEGVACDLGTRSRLRTAWNGRSGIACDFPVPASIAVSERLLGIFRDRGSSTGG